MFEELMDPLVPVTSIPHYSERKADSTVKRQRTYQLGKRWEKTLQPKASAFPVHFWFVGLILPIMSFVAIGDLAYLPMWRYRAMWTDIKVPNFKCLS